MDTKFSVAIHTIILISESPEPISSDRISLSVGTNASYIRKILSLLKNAGIVDGHRGVSGYVLLIPPHELDLLRIYRAVIEVEKVHILDIHQNTSDKCVVGRYIKPVLTGMFADMETAFEKSLADKTLADCISKIRNEIE